MADCMVSETSFSSLAATDGPGGATCGHRLRNLRMQSLAALESMLYRLAMHIIA